MFLFTCEIQKSDKKCTEEHGGLSKGRVFQSAPRLVKQSAYPIFDKYPWRAWAPRKKISPKQKIGLGRAGGRGQFFAWG